jgi:hypothetical protein
MPTPDLRWLLPARHALRAPKPPRAPVWPVATAVVVGLGLLLAFQQVVAQAVVQGELRRSNAAAQHAIDWRCQLDRRAGSPAACTATHPDMHVSMSSMSSMEK